MNVIARSEYELAYYDSALTITPRGHPLKEMYSWISRWHLHKRKCKWLHLRFKFWLPIPFSTLVYVWFTYTCKILVSSQPADPWTAYLPKICRWIDISHVNVLGRSILVKWTNPHAAQALSQKRGELSWLAFSRRQLCYF